MSSQLKERKRKKILKVVSHINKEDEQKVKDELLKKAKPTCKKCLGKGYIGYKDTKIVAEGTERIIKRIYQDCYCTFKDKIHKINIKI